MKEYVALYFPYSRVPESEWFTKVLLYWDRASSIVPCGHPSRDEPYQIELVKAGLLEYLSPQSLLPEMPEHFVSDFLEALERRPVNYSPPHMEYIYANKLPRQLLEALADRHLATPTPEQPDDQWQVDVETADSYMAYLASAVSASRPGTAPVTDHETLLATLKPSSPEETSPLEVLKQLRYAVIAETLPTPSRAVPPAELRVFKDKHHDALVRCRRWLDSRLADLASIAEPDLRQVKQVELMGTIADDVANLRESMTKRRWPKVSAASIGGIVSGQMAMAAQLVNDAPATALGWLLVAGAGLAGTVPGVYETVKAIRAPAWNPHAPLAYAALTSRSGSWW